MKKQFLAVALSALSFSTVAATSHLKVVTFNPRQEAIFDISSNLISGKKDAILINTQFQKNMPNNWLH